MPVRTIYCTSVILEGKDKWSLSPPEVGDAHLPPHLLLGSHYLPGDFANGIRHFGVQRCFFTHLC